MDKQTQKMLSQKIEAWANSPDGKKAIEETTENVRGVLADLDKSRRITPEMLNKPMDF